MTFTFYRGLLLDFMGILSVGTPLKTDIFVSLTLGLKDYLKFEIAL